MRYVRTTQAAIAAAALAGFMALAPSLAQTPATMPKTAPGSANPALVKAGTYQVEPGHTQISFSLDHMGFTPFMGELSEASGSLTLDPKKLSAAKLSISVPISSIHTSSSKLVDELISPQFFDAKQFPTATFVSTAVASTGPLTAKVTGNLTLHGVTKPVTLTTKFYGAGTSMMSKKASVGFIGAGQIKRSDFGIGAYVPLVGDEVTIAFAAAFEQ